MRKSIVNTKVSVKLRKSEYANEWYLYLEAYPVFVAGKKSAQRVREYLNRVITTPIWDKKHTARTTETSQTFKPKRDVNGIIQCKSENDQDACVYADAFARFASESMTMPPFTLTPRPSKPSRTNVQGAISLSISIR